MVKQATAAILFCWVAAASAEPPIACHWGFKAVGRRVVDNQQLKRRTVSHTEPLIYLQPFPVHGNPHIPPTGHQTSFNSFGHLYPGSSYVGHVVEKLGVADPGMTYEVRIMAGYAGP